MITIQYALFYKEFKKAIKCVGGSSRPILQNVRLYTKENRLYFESCSGYISWQSNIFITELDKEINLLLPAEAIYYLPKINWLNVPLIISEEDNSIVLKTNNTTLAFKQFEGQFPDISNHYKNEIDHKIKFNTKEFLKLIQGMNEFQINITKGGKLEPVFITGVSGSSNVNNLILPKKND